MTQAIQQSLRDKAWARWTVLILIALTMFFAYMFVDVLSPLKSMLEKTAEEGGLGWSSTVFGTYGSSEYFGQNGGTIYGCIVGSFDGSWCPYQSLCVEYYIQ